MGEKLIFTSFTDTEQYICKNVTIYWDPYLSLKCVGHAFLVFIFLEVLTCFISSWLTPIEYACTLQYSILKFAICIVQLVCRAEFVVSSLLTPPRSHKMTPNQDDQEVQFHSTEQAR